MKIDLTKSDIKLIKAALEAYTDDLETSIHCGQAYYKIYDPEDHYHKKLQKVEKLSNKLLKDIK